MSIRPYISGPNLKSARLCLRGGLSQIPEGLLLDTQEADLLFYIDDRLGVLFQCRLHLIQLGVNHKQRDRD